MRIIGGEYGGRKLTPLLGRDIRPTTDRMRETIFNILRHSSIDLEGATVLDVFAGTGAMGLEALSHGAAHATFFDNAPKSLQILKKNISLLGVKNKASVKNVSAPALPATGKQYDIVFLDPPYHLDVINDTLSALKEKKYLANNCIIIVEYSSGNALAYPDYFIATKEKTYGDARVIFLENNF
ncbi:MAG: 16S rRNA (guanine(966)-N(2))-methyltransferase RsmD [Alphaproteobacteria bacterium]|nr:MAG: 16S rRNA (guanine(966)-N(2))-methyltransferase RsmD [Alphaproteobacteria bacterium]